MKMIQEQDNVFENKKILIVGGAGFVGSNLLRAILGSSDQAQIKIIDNLLSSERSNVVDDPRIDFIEGSVTDDRVLGLIDDSYHYIFHLATYHGNQNSIHDPLADHENSTLTTLRLMNHVKDFKRIKKFVYSSAGCACAEKTFGCAAPTTEDASVSMVQDSPYSISKIIGEFYSVYFYRQHGLPTVRARFQNVYGPGEILGAGKWRGTSATVWRNVVPVFIYKALNRFPLPIENEGIATRDFIYIGDICRGLIACATDGKPGDVYNIASGKETKIIDLATLINQLTGNKAGFEFLPRRSWDFSGKRFGSTEKSKAELGFQASVGLKDGLVNTIEWTKRNILLIRQCIDRHITFLNVF